MRTRLLRRAVLILVAAATVGVVPAAQAQDGTLPFTIDTARLADDRHTVVVGGTYSCPQLDFDVVGGGGIIELTVNQGNVRGFGFGSIEVCDGTTRTWQATVTATDGRFRRGPAQVLASARVTGRDAAGETVTLRADILAPGQPITITSR
jgi:Family of unknown function (DUF6299)